MDLNQVQAMARERYQGFCKVCKICDGRVCAGQVPGMGGIGSGSSFTENVHQLAQIKFNLRTAHQAKIPS